MELRAVVVLHSLLLVSAGGSDNSASYKRLVSSPTGGIDLRKPTDLVTSSALVGGDANSGTVHVARGGASATGRRWRRAAEILGTSVNHQATLSLILPNTSSETSSTTSPIVTQKVPQLSTSTQASLNTSDEVSYSTTTTTAVPIEVSDSVTNATVSSSSSTDATLNATTATPTTTTITIVTSNTSTSTTTQSTPQSGNEEYVADDAATATTDATSDDDETTIVAVDKITTTQHPENSSSDETTPMSSPSVSSVVAVGRALSQEESVPWPEAKSTKVIGTIIEDIHGPYSDGVSSVSVGSPDVLTSSGIVAIVMCTFLVLLTTAGASGYWWYRRRYLLNRPETLSERYAPSETGLGAGDDIFRVGYVHSPELPRDSSEEMYSLDNDSFLTSLEAMTIPTYWTETIKHTKL